MVTSIEIDHVDHLGPRDRTAGTARAGRAGRRSQTRAAAGGGAANAAIAAIRIAIAGSTGSGGNRSGENARVQIGRAVAGADVQHDRGDHPARGDDPLRRAPGIGPVMGAVDPAAAERQSDAAKRRAGQDRGHCRAAAGALPSSSPYAPAHRPIIPASISAAVSRRVLRVCRAGAPVARASPSPPPAAATVPARPPAPGSRCCAAPAALCSGPRASGAPARPAGRSRPAAGATLIETTTATPSSYSAPGSTRNAALGVGERVGGADAADQRRQPQPVDCWPPASPPARPGRRSGRPRTNSASGCAAAETGCDRRASIPEREDRTEHDPHRDDEQRQQQVVLERARPRRVGAPVRRPRSRARRASAAAAAGWSCGSTATASPSAQIHQATGCSARGTRRSPVKADARVASRTRGRGRGRHGGAVVMRVGAGGATSTSRCRPRGRRPVRCR